MFIWNSSCSTLKAVDSTNPLEKSRQPYFMPARGAYKSWRQRRDPKKFWSPPHRFQQFKGDIAAQIFPKRARCFRTLMNLMVGCIIEFAQGRRIIISERDYNLHKSEEQRCESDEARYKVCGVAPEDTEILQYVR